MLLLLIFQKRLISESLGKRKLLRVREYECVCVCLYMYVCSLKGMLLHISPPMVWDFQGQHYTSCVRVCNSALFVLFPV